MCPFEDTTLEPNVGLLAVWFIPKSSISNLSGFIFAQLSTIKGLLILPDFAWMARDTTSLPEPGGPVIKSDYFLALLY